MIRMTKPTTKIVLSDKLLSVLEVLVSSIYLFESLKEIEISELRPIGAKIGIGNLHNFYETI